MITVLWPIMGAIFYWLIATVACGGLACGPYIVFFYAPYWASSIIYAGIAELAARKISDRWSPLLFLVFSVVGLVLQAFWVRFGTTLFRSSESTPVYINLIFGPTIGVTILFLLKSIWHWRLQKQRSAVIFRDER
jgi:hypothetical protein